MKMYLLEKIQFVPKPIQEVFEFFNKHENLSKLTPSSLGFQVLTPTPIQMEKGCLIDYTIKLFGMDQRWTTLITAYDAPHQFVDEQLRGPYSFWHHTHRFEQHKEGTNITDTVRYALPFGFFGRIAHTLFVRNQLHHIFEYRTEIIAKHFSR